jgi:SAM-dependent methyltransferase
MHKVCYRDHNWLAYKLNNENVGRNLHIMTGTVIDLGVGLRPYEADILNTSHAYVGVDWSNSIHSLRADIVADLNKPLPIADAVADTVVSFQVLEHLCEPQTMLEEAFRILRPGGVLFLSVPFQWWVHEAPHDYFRYTRYGLEHLLNKAGFSEIEIQEVSGFWVTWFLKLNYQTTRLIRGPRVTRWIVRMLLLPLWFTDQVIAPLLDKFWRCPEETQGYIALAKKL